MPTPFEEMLEGSPSLKRTYDLISKVGAESERGMTVLAAAELDRVLEGLLKAYLAPGNARDALFAGGSAPLGSFSAKINTARSLHLIREEEYALLQLIRRIRNEFAHNPDVGFSDARIVAWVRSMKDDGEYPDLKALFTLRSVSLIDTLETDAVAQANGRVYEESYNTFYRRGGDDTKSPFESAEQAAAYHKGGA